MAGAGTGGTIAPPSGDDELRRPTTDVEISAGGNHTCVLDAEGDVFCFGDESYGGSLYLEGPFRSISAGFARSCGVTASGELLCWRANQEPTTEAEGAFRQVTAGRPHICATTDNGSARCFGSSFWSAPDIEQPSGIYQRTSLTCGLRTSGEVSCWRWLDGHFIQPDALAPSPSGRFIDFSAGDELRCGVDVAGSLRCTTPSGAARFEEPGASYVQVSSRYDSACALQAGGSVQCFGAGAGDEPEGSFVQVSSGVGHACAITEDGSFTCWGDVPGRCSQAICEGGLLRACRSDGLGLAREAVDCAATAQICHEGECKTQVCTPDEVRCEGRNVQACDSLGLTTTERRCTGIQSCDAQSLECEDHISCTEGWICASPTSAAPCTENSTSYYADQAINCGANTEVCLEGACTDTYWFRDYEQTGDTGIGANGTSLSLSLPDSTTLSDVTMDFDPPANPAYIGFWVRSAQASNSMATLRFRSLNGMGGSHTTVWVGMWSDGTIVSHGGAETYSTPYTVDTWHHVELRGVNWQSASYSFYLDGVLIQAAGSFENQADTFEHGAMINYALDFEIVGSGDALIDEIRIGTKP